MNEIKQEFPNRVGFGLCRDDFTIEEKELAAFVNLNDAEEYVKTKIDNDLFSFQKVFYIDTQVQDRSSMLTVRYIYDNKQNKLIEGNEVLSGKSHIYIMGYEVSADYEDEEGNYDYSETGICLSSAAARMKKQEYLEDGAVEVNIYDKDDIGIRAYFWGADKFLRGDANNDKVGRIISDMRNTPSKEGKTVAQRVGMVLEDVRHEAQQKLIEQDVKEMSQEEKDAFISGTEMSADYGLEISEYDKKLYQQLIAERTQKQRRETSAAGKQRDYEYER